MTEKYILVSDEEYCYTLNTQSEHYKTLEDFEKQELENAKKDNVDINQYEDKILQLANDNYWDWIYNNHLEPDAVNDIINELTDKNEQLKVIVKEVIELLSEYGFDLEDLYKLLKRGVDAEICKHRELLKITERMIETHLSEGHNQNYQSIKSQVLFSEPPMEILKKNCRCNVAPVRLFNGVESEKER